MRKWKVVQWTGKPEDVAAWVPLDCPCGYEAKCPASVRAPIIAAVGMRLVFDPPDYQPPENYLPDIIKCRKCGRMYSSRED